MCRLYVTPWSNDIYDGHFLPQGEHCVCPAYCKHSCTGYMRHKLDVTTMAIIDADHYPTHVILTGGRIIHSAVLNHLLGCVPNLAFCKARDIR